MADVVKMLDVVAVGPKAGKSGVFGGFVFKDGVAQVMSSSTAALSILARYYNAHPKGSPGHLEAVEKWEKATGKEQAKTPPAPPSAPVDLPDLKELTVDELKALGKEKFNQDLTGNKLQIIQQLTKLAGKE